MPINKMYILMPIILQNNILYFVEHKRKKVGNDGNHMLLRGHFIVLLVVIGAIPYQTKCKYRITTNDFIYCVDLSITPHPTR